MDSVRKILHKFCSANPPLMDAPPTYWQLRRMCRWQARQLRRIAQATGADPRQQQRADVQAAEIASTLRHHPLRDDLQRIIRQSADLLQELAPDTVLPELS